MTIFTGVYFAILGQTEPSMSTLDKLKLKLSDVSTSSRNLIIYNELNNLEEQGIGYDLSFIQSVDSLLVVDKELYLDNLVVIGRKLSLDGNKREAYTFLNRVLIGIDKGQKLNRQCDFYETIGDCYFFFKHFEQAKTFLLKAISCPEINNLSKINVYNTLGLIHMKFDGAKAESYFLRAIKIAEQEDHKLWYGVITGNIGGLYFDREKYDLALQFFETDSNLVWSMVYLIVL